MRMRLTSRGIEVWAPAKVNLFLEVLARRSDGFHELDTIMVSVSVYDTLIANTTKDDRLDVSCLPAAGAAGQSQLAGSVPAGPANSVYRALLAMRQWSGVRRGAQVSLVKRIPTQAGLGSASTDAAAALLAAAHLWNVRPTREELVQLAGQLGSDTPFFLFGGSARCTGRGERVQPLEAPAGMPLVIVKPPVGLSTAEVFARCQVPQQPLASAPLTAALAAGDFRRVAQRMWNRLADAARGMTDRLHPVQRQLARLNASGHQMTGSGTSLFAVFACWYTARRAARLLRSRLQDCWVCACRTTGPARPPGSLKGVES